MIREKLKKEQIISDLTEKHKNLAQQQEKDKGIKTVLSYHLNTFFTCFSSICYQTAQKRVSAIDKC